MVLRLLVAVGFARRLGAFDDPTDWIHCGFGKHCGLWEAGASRLVLRGFHDTAFIVIDIDASASVTVLALRAPKSLPMHLVWEAILDRTEYKS